MSSVLEILERYQLLTNLLPGVFFGVITKFFLEQSFLSQNFTEDIAVSYFMGFIINRIGSLVVEPILKKLCFIKFSPYPSFIEAAKLDSKIEVLSEINTYFRSLLTCTLLLPFIWILQILSSKWPWFALNWKYVSIAPLIALILFSYKKQTKYIQKRIEEAINRQAKENGKE